MEQDDISRHHGFGLNFHRLAVALTSRLNLHHSQQLLHGIGSPPLLPEAEKSAYQDDAENDDRVKCVPQK